MRLQVDALEREVENAREVERKLENKLMEVMTDFVIILHVLSVHSDAGGRLLPQVWDSFQIPVQAGNLVCYLRRSAFLFMVYGSWLRGFVSGLAAFGIRMCCLVKGNFCS